MVIDHLLYQGPGAFAIGIDLAPVGLHAGNGVLLRIQSFVLSLGLLSG